MDLTPRVEDLSKAIQSLPELLNAIASLSASGWVIVLLLFLWILLNKDFSHIFDLFEKKEKIRFERIDAYVQSNEIADASVFKAVQDIRDAQYFKVATGIYAESRFRNALIGLHEVTSHLITWRQISRALPYLNLEADGHISVREMTKFERLGFWYNKIMAYVLFFLAASLMGLLVISGGKTFLSLAMAFGGAFFSLLLGIFALAQNFPEDASRRIAKELEGIAKVDE